MDPTHNQSLPKTSSVPNNTSSISSAASSCSITSGTPSTDLRFAEYQLDKIVSHFTPDDEDGTHFNERPIRAYSVGSRLEHNKRKMRVDMLATEHSNNDSTSRVRAFSVGSKAKVTRSELYRNAKSTKTSSLDIANLMTTINNNNNNNNANSINNNHPMAVNKTSVANSIINNNISGDSSKGTRSSKRSISTPMLNATTKNNSIDPMDDLMEIDFTKRDDDTLSTESNYDHNRVSCDDLMEIDYPQLFPPSFGSSSSSICSTSNQATGSNANAAAMRKKSASISSSTDASSSSRVSQPVPIVNRRSDMMTQAEQQKDKDGYISMKPVGNSIQMSPTKSTSVRPPTAASPSMRRSMSSTTPTVTRLPTINHEDYLDMSPISVKSATSIASSHDHAATEGYMEMSWNRSSTGASRIEPSANANASNALAAGTNNSNQLNLQSSSSSISSSNEYINMNFGGNIPRTSSVSSDCSTGSGRNVSRSGNNDTNSSNNSRMRSNPITIQTKKSPQTCSQSQHSNAAQPLPNHHPQSFAANKIFPPKFLKINTNVASALNQLESSMDEGETVTPIATDASQHPSTIFPFSPNSPSSGASKPLFSSQQSNAANVMHAEDQKRKCLIDGTTGESLIAAVHVVCFTNRANSCLS